MKRDAEQDNIGALRLNFLQNRFPPADNRHHIVVFLH